MSDSARLPQRKSIRLRGYDYSQAGAYFVTICTADRQCTLGSVAGSLARPSAIGSIVAECWNRLPQHFSRVLLDAFVIMPNHLHGIIVLEGRGEALEGGDAAALSSTALSPRTVGASPPNASPLLPRGTAEGSLGAIVQSFKSVSTRRINDLHGARGTPFWQRNYYEHVVRNDHDLDEIREYIANNPLKWELDQYHPERKPR